MTEPAFTDGEHQSAEDKAKVYKAWVAFLKSGLAWPKFTEALYKHLTLYCSHSAHFNRGGYYTFYFGEPGEHTQRFLDQFDPDKPGHGAELGGAYWHTDERWKDINGAMREAARSFVAKLREAMKTSEREQDLAHARALLAKHGEKA